MNLHWFGCRRAQPGSSATRDDDGTASGDEKINRLF